MTDFRNQSPWGTPPGGSGSGNGGFRKGPTPPNIYEVISKLQSIINRFLGGGKGGAKPIILGLIILLIYGLIYKVLRRILKQIGIKRLKDNELRFTAVSEAFGAIKEIKIGGLEEVYVERFAKPSRSYSWNQAKTKIITNITKKTARKYKAENLYCLCNKYNIRALVQT